MTEHYNVLVKPGYAEDAANGWLWMNYSSEKKLTNKQIAEDLEEVIRACAKHVIDSKQAWSTKQHQKCPPQDEGNFCSNCGGALPDPDELEELIEDESSAIVRDLYAYNTVDVNQEYLDVLESNGWSLWGSPVNGRIVFITGPDRGIQGYTHLPEIESKRAVFK